MPRYHESLVIKNKCAWCRCGDERLRVKRPGRVPGARGSGRIHLHIVPSQSAIFRVGRFRRVPLTHAWMKMHLPP
ncbi:hypothetical protein NDU88_001518 [Pleurodeles waltl]|uniref:Uncharacterized protein n=1 Tax=Pleurodeles waltl TaxID=8319 RepID=A0AAV7SZG6_PLEWA|nr:hypothetical protein NDU88_001518 [Pleurodeles waltl]